MRGPTKLSEALSGLRWKRPPAVRGREAAVFEAFARALDDRARGGARPVSLRRGVLRVEVESAARLHELAAYGQEGCVARTNDLLGLPLVRRIDFRLAPSGPSGEGG